MEPISIPLSIPRRRRRREMEKCHSINPIRLFLLLLLLLLLLLPLSVASNVLVCSYVESCSVRGKLEKDPNFIPLRGFPTNCLLISCFFQQGIWATKLTILQADPFAKQKFSACFGPQLLFQTFKSEFYAKPKIVWHAFSPFLVPGQQLQCCSSLGGQRHRNIDLLNEEGKLSLGHRHPTQPSTVSLSLLLLPQAAAMTFGDTRVRKALKSTFFPTMSDYFPFISLF